MTGVCGPGYYRDVLSAANSNLGLTGNLSVGSDICLPCDELCSQCTGPGLDMAVCSECAFAMTTQGECVAECNKSAGKWSFEGGEKISKNRIT